ncbi:MAG TPA: hypothetical protein DCQ51_06840 [Planktothrix sp. UBA8407]|jgi:GUN4-like./TIR domain.|nr:hypothetical protein [Planktothrix sp. UBA8407]
MTENSSQLTRAIEIVYCHSDNDQDRELRNELEKHLMTMQREGIITTWHEDKIGAGQEWQSEIDKRIDTARIILPLISADFVNSDKSYELELQRAIGRHISLEAYVIPIILRPVDWQNIKFKDFNDNDITLGDMTVLPEHGLAVTRWQNCDEALLNIAQNIRQVIKQIWQRDEWGIEDAYSQLKEELTAQEWQKANETTKYLIFKIANQEQTGNLNQDSIKNIPSRDIRVINNWWVQYSRGHFGFSIQKKLLRQNDYQEVLSQIGWFVNDSWLKEEDLNFSLNAPQGHLPYCGNHFWEAKPSPAPVTSTITYYRLQPPGFTYQQYRIPPNYYRWRDEQQRKFKEQFSVENKLKQQFNFESPFSPSPPVTPISPGSGGGGLAPVIGTIATIATKALPWAIGITVVAGVIYAGVKIYDHIEKEKEKEKEENEIKGNINALISHLDSWTI